MISTKKIQTMRTKEQGMIEEDESIHQIQKEDAKHNNDSRIHKPKEEDVSEEDNDVTVEPVDNEQEGEVGKNYEQQPDEVQVPPLMVRPRVGLSFKLKALERRYGWLYDS